MSESVHPLHEIFPGLSAFGIKEHGDRFTVALTPGSPQFLCSHRRDLCFESVPGNFPIGSAYGSPGEVMLRVF